MRGNIIVLALCCLLFPWAASAREQVGPVRERPPAREHLANTRKMPLSRLLVLCGDVKKMIALDGELGQRPLTQDDIYVVSNGTKCIAATAAILETIRVMAPMYQEELICMPTGSKDQDLLPGFLEWVEYLDRNGIDDIFKLPAPAAFILYFQKKHPC